MRVLVVEDEVKMAALLRRGLGEAGHVAEVASSGEQAVAMGRASGYDAIVLDVMLPGMDGFAACRKLREHGVWAPVLMLTARSGVADRVAGLDCGADDYLGKPFAFSELLARLRSLTRRGQPTRPNEVVVGDLRLDPAARRAWRGTIELELTTKEFALLEMLARHAGMVVSRTSLLEYCWGYEREHRSNIVEAYIRLLREKIDRPFGVRSVETVRGAGYRLRRDAGC